MIMVLEFEGVEDGKEEAFEIQEYESASFMTRFQHSILCISTDM